MTVDVLEGVQALLPQIEASAAEAERARRIPDENIAALAATGLFSTLVPKDLGGLQLDLATLTGATRLLGRACTSTGWVASFYGVHGWLLSLMSPEATEVIFAERPYVLAPGTFAPNGRAERTAEGYVLSGRWAWGTGVLHSDWAMLAGIVPRADGRPDLRMFVAPMSALTVEDTWHTDGMRATGSNDIVADEVTVPTELTLSFGAISAGCPEGDPPYDDPIYGWPLVPALCLTACAPLLGTAEAVLDAYERRLTERVMTYSGGKKQKDVPAARSRLATATVTLRGAQLLFDEAVTRLDAVRAGAAPLTLDDRVRIRWQAAWVVGTCRQLVNDIVAASGASVHRLDSPLQRAQRDLNTASGHVVFDLDTGADLYGLHALGLDLPPTALV